MSENERYASILLAVFMGVAFAFWLVHALVS